MNSILMSRSRWLVRLNFFLVLLLNGIRRGQFFQPAAPSQARQCKKRGRNQTVTFRQRITACIHGSDVSVRPDHFMSVTWPVLVCVFEPPPTTMPKPLASLKNLTVPFFISVPPPPPPPLHGLLPSTARPLVPMSLTDFTIPQTARPVGG